MTENKTGSFVCVCGEDYPTEMALTDHARDMHAALKADDVETYVCPECGSTFATYAQVREHFPAHGLGSARPSQAESA